MLITFQIAPHKIQTDIYKWTDEFSNQGTKEFKEQFKPLLKRAYQLKNSRAGLVIFLQS